MDVSGTTIPTATELSFQKATEVSGKEKSRGIGNVTRE